MDDEMWNSECGMRNGDNSGFGVQVSFLISRILFRRTFEVLVAVNELQIELEPVDLPAAFPFDEMEIITADEDPGILVRGVREVGKKSGYNHARVKDIFMLSRLIFNDIVDPIRAKKE
jgi:hypothetical protein